MARLSILLLVVMTVLAGCAQAPDVTLPISFMIFGDPAEKAAYEHLVTSFAERRPDIHVKLMHIPSQSDYRKRLGLDFSAGTPADIVLLNYRRYGNFAAKGVLEPLGGYLSRSTVITETDFYPQSIEPFYWRGQLMCIPQNLSSLVIYYNKELFDAAGLPYPEDDWTWDDFLRTAKKLTRDSDGDGSIDQYGVGLEPNLIRLAPFIWQNEGDIVFNPDAPTRLTLDKPEATEAMQWFVDLQVKHQVVPNAVEEQAEDSESRFQHGRTAMFFDSRRAVPTLREAAAFDWDVAPLPRGEQRASVLHADAYCMAAQTQHKDAAWDFIEFANSVEGQTIVAASGRTVPSLQTVAQSPIFGQPDAKPEHNNVFLDAIPHLRRVPVTANWVDVEEVVDSELKRAFYGEVSVEEAIATANTRTIEFLKLTASVPLSSSADNTAQMESEEDKLPACAASALAVPVPADFPRPIKLIAGARVLQQYTYPQQSKYYLLAVAPATLEQAASFYREQLPEEGYTVSPGDAEPGEIDLVIEGQGLQANLRLGSPANCPEATLIEILHQDKVGGS